MKTEPANTFRERQHALLQAVKARVSGSVSDCSKTKYLCVAIDLVMEDLPRHDYATCDAGRELKNLIHERLGGVPTLEAWLEKNHRISIGYAYRNEFRDKFQTTRHAWIDDLIKEFS